MAKYLYSFILIVHGLIHLLGFVKAFELAPVDQLSQNISRPLGLFWLTTTVMFLSTSVLYLLKIDSWWMAGAAAVVISQVLIILSWSDAKYGTIGNIIVIVPVIIAFAGQMPGSYQNRFESEVEKNLQRHKPQEQLTESDIAHLPLPVQKYIRYSGALGKEKLHHLRAVFRGHFKTGPEAGFLNIRSVQYNFFDEPMRAFYMQSSRFGLPVEALHLYVGPKATMQVKVAKLVEVVRAEGPEMNRSESVTLLNDICFLAPAALIDDRIAWETIDPTTVEATFSNQGNSVSARLIFNEEGQLINFISDDRTLSTDGITFKNYPWSTPLDKYKMFGDRTVASYGEAVWHRPEGEFIYAKFNLERIEYNPSKYADTWDRPGNNRPR